MILKVSFLSGFIYNISQLSPLGRFYQRILCCFLHAEYISKLAAIDTFLIK